MILANIIVVLVNTNQKYGRILTNAIRVIDDLGKLER